MKNGIICFVFLLMSVKAYASGTDYCKDLLNQSLFKYSIDESTNNQNLIDMIPGHLRAKTNQKISCYEGNCFNAALRWDRENMVRGNTSLKEINDALWFDYDYLHEGQDLRLGDIIVMRSSDVSEDKNILHTARFIDKNMVWHKKGQGLNIPWAFETFLDAFRTYYRISNSNIYLEYYRKK